MIVVDARKIADGGIGSYIKSILEVAAEYSREVGVLLPTNKLLSSRVRASEFEEVQDYIEKVKKRYTWTCSDIGLNSPRELFRLGRFLKKNFPLTAYHSPHFTLPLDVRCSSLVTVHDVTLNTFPRTSLRKKVSDYLIKSSLKRAGHLITVSEANKSSISKIYGAGPEIFVLPNALPSEYYSQVSSERFRVLVVGTDRPHKNLKDSFRVWMTGYQKEPELFSKLVLTVVAPSLTPVNQQVFDSLPGKKELLSNVSGYELRMLYAEAKALLVSSLSEGFHLPSLEAAASKTPIAGYDLPQIRERSVCQYLSNPKDADGLLEALMQILKTKPFSDEELQRASAEVKEQFSLEQFKANLFSIYDCLA